MNDLPLDHLKRPSAVVWRKVAELKPNPKNPRRHSASQIRRMKRSIRSFGLTNPLLIDRDDMLVCGHARLEAAVGLGITDVPTICLAHLTPAQVRAYMIADNRLAEHSTWDEQLLGEHFKELTLALDLDVELTGFDMGEIDLRIEGLEPVKDDDADALPEPALSPILSCIGDIWQLGAHRICCGDSLQEPAYSALMEGKAAAAVFSDLPYNVAISGHAGGMGSVQHREFPMASGEMSEREFIVFLTRAMRHMAKHSRAGSVHYLMMDWRHLHELLTAGRDVYDQILNVCVWAKDHGGMGSFYRSAHELIFVFKSGKGAHRNNVQLGQYGRNRTNVWHYSSPAAFGRTTEEGRLLDLHPTVKPVALVADAILDCSARGEIVLDAFLGSGTTVIAAERTGRICYGLELDPGYVDVVVRRWQAFTGEQARHAGTGMTFEEIAIERSTSNG